MNIFTCTKCNANLHGFFPNKCNCGFETPIINGIYQFTDDSPISTNDNLQWLGYEHVGENYEPGYLHNKAGDNIADSDNLVLFLGKGKVVLDIGAGLGVTAISYAKSGLNVIAADISQTMLEAAHSRAKFHNVNNIVFARMNGYKLTLADNSVDAVSETDMLHQVNHPELVVAEIKRVLKPDGFFLQGGGTDSLGYTDEQKTDNAKYNDILKDITNYYDSQVLALGYTSPLFSSHQQADNSKTENFTHFKTIKHTGSYGSNNSKWFLKMGLHKLKTKASGAKQFIPQDIHNTAWANTHEYAIDKYGEGYENIYRWFNFRGNIALYTKL